MLEQNDLKHNLTHRRSETFHIVALGASAGGFEALNDFFLLMPDDSGCAFIVVSHLSPNQESLLPQLLAKSTKMPVSQAKNGVLVEPNKVYVIPPNKLISIENFRICVSETSHGHSTFLPIDTLMNSLALSHGEMVIGIVLSGTGKDGTAGLKAIKYHRGVSLVQDPSSAVFDEMPRSAIKSGYADFIITPARMPDKVLKLLSRRPSVQNNRLTLTADTLNHIYAILHSTTDHDFSQYKSNTIARRIERRMDLLSVTDLTEYIGILKNRSEEANELFRDLLIGVTSFFRDPAAFDALAVELKLYVKNELAEDRNLRVWVPACSTGEEAYSIAMLLHETMCVEHPFSLQIFATDIDQEAIACARRGLFPKDIEKEISKERLERFFSLEEKGYRIKKKVRESIIFAPQSVIKDPPFTKLDLLSCRNLMIYFEPALQKRILSLFHYSLCPGGLLFIGSSETVSSSAKLYETKNKKWKIFQRQATSDKIRGVMDFPSSAVSATNPVLNIESDSSWEDPKLEDKALVDLVEAILQQSNVPTSIVVDRNGDIVYVHGHTAGFLEAPQGKASLNLIKMADPAIKDRLAAAIKKTSLQKNETRLSRLEVTRDERQIIFDVVVTPMAPTSMLTGLILVVFKSVSEAPSRDVHPESPVHKSRKRTTKKNIAELENELQTTRNDLQSSIEALEVSNEELKCTNEELQSTNEELQSSNEELETSKEELQSLNEESATVNAELQARVDELSHANDDMKNLLDSTDIATLFLDSELRIRRFTPSVNKFMSLTPQDNGRLVLDFSSRLKNVDFAGIVEQVLEDLGVHEVETNSDEGLHYLIRARPYRTLSNVIDGVVFTFEDISISRKIINELKKQQRLVDAILSTVRAPMMVIDNTGKVIRFNQACALLTGVAIEEIEGQKIESFLVFPDEGNEGMDKMKTLFEGRDESGENALTLRFKNNRGVTKDSEWAIKQLEYESSDGFEFIICTSSDLI